MSTYTTQGVETRYEYGRYLPAVNVKVRDAGLIEPADVAAEAGEDAGDVRAWWESLGDDEREGMMSTAFGWACEDGFDQAAELAGETFPMPVELWQEGRQGGWLVVDGLGDVDTWTPELLACWDIFEREARSIAKNVAHNMARLIVLNYYEAARADQQALAAMEDRWAGLAGMVPA